MEALLSDVRVLELGHIVSAPSAGLILAEMGADVIKVERPDGGNQYRSRPEQSMFLAYNATKRSMALNLKNQKGKEIFLQLVRKADIVVDNYAPGALDRLGLTYETMSKTNPGIIHCSIKGFLPGPNGALPLLDEPAQMMGGLAYMTGPPGRPLRAGTSIIDMGAAMFGIMGVLAALHERERTGCGRKIHVGLFETSVFFVARHMATAGVTGKCPPPMPARGMAEDAGWTIYRIFLTRDQKMIFIAVTSDAHWERFCREFQLDDLREDPSLRTSAGRGRQPINTLINERVDKIVRELLRDTLVERLGRCQIPFSPVNTPMDLFNDPHLRGRGHFFKATAPNGDSSELPSLPVTFDDWPGPVRLNPPTLGEHTSEIMADLGYSSDQIKSLIEEGAIGRVVPNL